MAYALKTTSAAERDLAALPRAVLLRVLYAIDDRRKLIEVARILHRREAYRDL